MSQQFVIMQKTCKNDHCKRKFDKTSPSDLCQACSAAFKSGETQAQRRNDLYEEKIQELVEENATIKIRLESLETWALKINENVGHKEKISFQSKLRSERNCKVCKESFSKNCELENHMVTIHASEKTHACQTCGKTFVLKWRLEKHFGIHQGNVKTCNYLKEGKECPFEDIGCKFSHKETNVAVVVTRNESIKVKSTASTTLGVDGIFDSTKNYVEEVVEKNDNEEATSKLEGGGHITENGVSSEICVDPSTSSFPLAKSQPFFDLDNPNVYPPIVYPTQTVYPQNPCIVYPQNPHMYPQNPQTQPAGASSLPSIDELFPPRYNIPPRSNSSFCWKY